MLLAACALLAHGQGAPDTAWLASDGARSFRDRVVELALIYGSSSGIDPRGYKVEARRTGDLVQGCAPVAVTTSLHALVTREETLQACRRHGAH